MVFETGELERPKFDCTYTCTSRVLRYVICGEYRLHNVMFRLVYKKSVNSSLAPMIKEKKNKNLNGLAHLW